MVEGQRGRVAEWQSVARRMSRQNTQADLQEANLTLSQHVMKAERQRGREANNVCVERAI